MCMFTGDTLLLDFALDWIVRIADRVQPQTRDGYRQSLTIHWLPMLGHLPLREVRRRDIRDGLRTLLAKGRAANSCRNDLRVIGMCLEDALDDELLTVNPARGAGRLVFPREPRPVRALTEEQAKALLQAASGAPDTFDLVCLLLILGVRIGELLAARWGDFDLERHTFTIERALNRHGVGRTKTKRTSVVEIPTFAAHIIAARHHDFDDTEYVFESPVRRGRPMSYVSAWRMVRAAFARAGIVGTAHGLRHTLATGLLAFTDASVVQMQLTHASIQTTMDTYVRRPPHRARPALDSYAAPLAAAVTPPRRRASGAW